MTASPVNLRPEAGSRRGLRRERKGSPPGQGVPCPEWARGAVVYSVYPRAFSPAGDLEGVTARLPGIAALGARILWLLPIHPTGQVARKGPLGSPYAIRDYRSVNPEYGDAESLRRLVREAHRLGLRVILDLVLNHGAPDNVLGLAHPDWFRRDARGRPTRRVGGWWDVADWNFGAPGLAEALLDVVEYWVREFDVDGYRCDVAGMVPAEFWARARERLAALKPDHFLLAEWDDPALHRAAFHATYDWELYRALRAVARGARPALDLPGILARTSRQFPAGAERLRFVENHDECRAPRRFGSRTPAALAFTVLSGGMPLVYNGQEAGARWRPGLFDRDPIDWERPGAESTRRTLTSLLGLAAGFTSLRSAAPLAGGGTHRLAAFERRGPDGRRLVVAANFAGQFTGLPFGLRSAIEGLRLCWPPEGGLSSGSIPRLAPGAGVAWSG